MIKAILYVSNTGNTKRYAEMAAEMSGVPAYPLSTAGEHVKSNTDEVFYMGWVRQGRVKYYAKAAMLFSIAGVCGVGMSSSTEKSTVLLRERTQISDPKVRVFYVQGGFDMNKLVGLDKLMMSAVLKTTRQKLGSLNEKAGEKNAEYRAIIDILENGADHFSKEQVAPIAAWIIKRNALFERMQYEDT